jgi:hypothetical protein
MKIISRFDSNNGAEYSLSEIYKNILNDLIYGCKLNNQIDIMFGKRLIEQIVIEKV